MSPQAVRWNVKVSRETDLNLRTHLEARGMKKGGLSSFVEQAVRTRILHDMVEEIHANNAKEDPATLLAEIDLAVKEARAERRRDRRP